MDIFNTTSKDIFHNMKIKEYPDGDFKITVASKPIFKEKGFELRDEKEKIPKPKQQKGLSRDDSIRRAKDRVSDIIRMNEFSCFVTLTFDGAKIDRSSVDDVKSKLNNFLSNHVQRSELKYVLIPEYHKKASAIHFHAFICGNLTLTDSGTVKAKGFKKPIKRETAKRYGIPESDCTTVYNLPQWQWGFSTAILTDGNNTALSKYITKYITKDVQKIFGNFYFAGGHGLKRDVPVTLTDTDYQDFEADSECYCPATDTSFKYLDTANRKGAEDDI